MVHLELENTAYRLDSTFDAPEDCGGPAPRPSPQDILFVTPSVSVETSSGGSLVTLERLRELSRYHHVTVLTMFVDDAARAQFSNVTWRVAGALRPRSAVALARSYFDTLPLSVWRNTNDALLKSAAEISTQNFDLLYVDHWLMIEVAKMANAKQRVLHLHNAEPEIFFRAAERASVVKRLAMQREGHRSVGYLRRVLPHFDALHLLSVDDIKALRDRGISHADTQVFLPSVSVQKTATPRFSHRLNEALFVGTLSWYANEEGLLWYAENVLPRHSKPYDHQIVGQGARAGLRHVLKTAKGVTMHGYVQDLEPHYQSAKCLIAPLLSGSGIKIKIINALARGLPVVTTTRGVEGFPDGYGTAICVEDDPKAFADGVDRFMTDAALWQRASDHARAYYHAHFQGQDWAQWVKEVGQ